MQDTPRVGARRNGSEHEHGTIHAAFARPVRLAPFAIAPVPKQAVLARIATPARDAKIARQHDETMPPERTSDGPMPRPRASADERRP